MFDKLKSIFIVEDEASKKAKAAQSNEKAAPKDNVPATKPSSRATSQQVESKPYVPPKGGQPDEKFVNMLLGAIEKNNIEGFDYLEYKQALQNLGTVEMDESTRYKSAMAMARTMGASQDGLLKSANHYIKVLTHEEKKFLDAFQNQQNARINSQNSEIQSLEKSIQDKTKRIEQLKAEIESETKSLEDKKNNIKNAADKVTATKDRFYIAFNIVVDQIKSDITKIKKYL